MEEAEFPDVLAVGGFECSVVNVIVNGIGDEEAEGFAVEAHGGKGVTDIAEQLFVELFRHGTAPFLPRLGCGDDGDSFGIPFRHGYLLGVGDGMCYSSVFHNHSFFSQS